MNKALLYAINDIDDNLITNADKSTYSKRRIVLKVAIACMIVCAVISPIANLLTSFSLGCNLSVYHLYAYKESFYYATNYGICKYTSKTGSNIYIEADYISFAAKDNKIYYIKGNSIFCKNLDNDKQKQLFTFSDNSKDAQVYENVVDNTILLQLSFKKKDEYYCPFYKVNIVTGKCKNLGEDFDYSNYYTPPDKKIIKLVEKNKLISTCSGAVLTKKHIFVNSYTENPMVYSFSNDKNGKITYKLESENLKYSYGFSWENLFSSKPFYSYMITKMLEGLLFCFVLPVGLISLSVIVYKRNHYKSK